MRAHKLAIWWLIVTLLGVIMISSTTGALRLLGPVLLMLVYARRGYVYAKSAGALVALRQARVGQLADSLYFLGFLWTLWALIDSFVIHQMSIAEAVFRAFGYALVTTAAGMSLRLFLLQFGYSEEEQIGLAERTVEEEIARFSQEVRNAVDSISAFRRQTDDALSAWIDSLNKSTGALKMAVDDVRVQTADLKDVLAEIHKVSVDHVEKLVEMALDQLVRKFEPSLEALNNANKQFVAEVNVSATKVKNAVDSGIRSVEVAIHAITEQMRSGLARSADAISGSLEESARSIDKAITTFAETLSEQTANLGSGLESLSRQIQQIHVPGDIIEKTVAQQVATATEGLVVSTRALQDAMKGATATFTETLLAQTANLGSGLANLSKQIQEIRVPGDIVEKIVEKSVAEQLARVNACLEESAKAFQEAIEDLSKQIREIHLPADLVEKLVAQQVATATTSLAESARVLQDAVNKLERLVLTVMEQVRPVRSRPWLVEVLAYIEAQVTRAIGTWRKICGSQDRKGPV
jgi:esterase/lipase